MFIVTIKQESGYVFNHEVPAARLKQFLAEASAVLFPGETLSYKPA